MSKFIENIIVRSLLKKEEQEGSQVRFEIIILQKAD